MNREIELPLGKRGKLYRLFEILPGLASYTALALLFILSFVRPLWAAIYLLLVVITMAVKAITISFNTIRGHKRLSIAQKLDWPALLSDLEDPESAYVRLSGHMPDKKVRFHSENIEQIIYSKVPFPKPSQVVNAIIIAAYNESYEVLKTTIDSVLATTYDDKRIVLWLTYEQRGGAEIEQTAKRLSREYRDKFLSFQISRHPSGIKNEVVGKGGNITYAGRQLERWCAKNKINFDDVIVTTLDSDNRPHKYYFDYVTYEFIVREDRERLSFQPIALYFGNIWDAPAPMRLIATGNSFWTVISSVRPRTLRNFSAHSQPLSALVKMNFWSTRSIVEDGHQYWRSYFFFKGDYDVIPIHVPVYQDVVMSDTYWRTFVSQFKQLRRWGYGVSDIPYVATRLFTTNRPAPFWSTFARFMRLIDSHITLAVIATMITLGGWIPLLVNTESSREIVAHMLPVTVSRIQQIAMIGIIVSIFLMMRMLPPRPERYKRRRTVGMVAQWALLPLTSMLYGSLSSFSAQTLLMTGRYLDKFDVTEKATISSVKRAKELSRARKNKKSP